MSRSWFPSVVAALLIAVSVPAVAQSKVPLAEEGHINEQLIAAAAGDKLRQTCPSLSARMLVVLLKMKQLESYARSEGYAEEEVTLFMIEWHGHRFAINALFQMPRATARSIEFTCET